MSSLQQIKENKNYRSAAIILLILLLWMLSGLFRDNNDKATADNSREPVAEGLFKVRAKVIHAQPYTPQLRISARTEANRIVNVRAEVSGQISQLPVKKGSLVKAGDSICQLAVEDRQLQVEQAQALVNKSSLEYDASLQLKNSGFQARTVIAAKKSELETAKALLKRAQIDLEKINIRAPFDGVVDSRPVEMGDLMQRGDICATVLDFDPLIVAGQVAGANVNQINNDDDVSALLLTGEQVQGKVRFISSSSDNLTRTFRIEAAVNNPQNLLHSGITAEILLAAQPIMAHLISPSLLALDDQGKIGVRIINPHSRVEFINVTLLGDDSNGVWISGLPETTTLITVGQEYVSHGQQIVAVMEDELNNKTPMALQKNNEPEPSLENTSSAEAISN